MGSFITRLDEKLEKLDDKLDNHAIVMTEMKKEVEYNRKGLDEHMAQTKAIIARIEPLEDHVADVKRFMKRLLWVTGAIVSIGGPLINHLIEKLTK